MCSTYDVTGDLELKTPLNPDSLPGDVAVWELTNFGAECSSKDCGSLPAPSSSLFITAIVLDGFADGAPYISAAQLTHPLKLAEDADETYLTFAGEVNRVSLAEKIAGSFVLTGGPPGLTMITTMKRYAKNLVWRR